MKLSRKLKSKLKTRLISAMVLVATAVLVFVCSGIDTTVEKIISAVNSENKQAVANSSVDVVKDSTGISIKVNAKNDNGVNKVEILQGSTVVQTYNYGGTNTEEEVSTKVTIPFGETKLYTVKVNNVVVEQKDVTNMRCISTAADMVAFRNAVNGGNNFSGKYVELTNDIDLSSVCSSSVGSWVPIGVNYDKGFHGTFEGHNHKLFNMYMNIDSDYCTGLFGYIVNGYVGHIVLSGSLVSTYQVGGIAGYALNSTINGCVNYATANVNSSKFLWSTYAAGILAYARENVIVSNCSNYGNININCTQNSNGGGIVTASSRTLTIVNCANYGNVSGGESSGGIMGHFGSDESSETGKYTLKISNCGNSGNITTKYIGDTPHAGGILGVVMRGETAIITNCYNRGNFNVTYKSYSTGIGGIIGAIGDWGTQAYGTVTNCYNTGNVTVINGGSGGAVPGYIIGYGPKGRTITNCYHLSTITGYNSSYTYGSISTTSANLKTYANNLGANNWIADAYGINNGYPISRWQIPSFELNVNQTYMHVGETLQLVVDTSKSSASLGNITWASMDSSVAQVDSTGKVTAIGEGYTTIYATESTYSLKAMAIVNVAKNGTVAFAQVELRSNSQTIVLKEDGTVWAVGANTYGQLGNGTNVSSDEPVQVMIDNKTPLTNVVKISMGALHATALTKDGYVYAWGSNSYGQLGINDTVNKKFATKVLGLDTDEFLNNIVDIENGFWYSHAVGKDGTVYSWGRNDEAGQLGIGNTTNKYVPQIALCNNAIEVTADYASSSILTQSGIITSWGMRRKWKTCFRK